MLSKASQYAGLGLANYKLTKIFQDSELECGFHWQI